MLLFVSFFLTPLGVRFILNFTVVFSVSLGMARAHGWLRRYLKAFCKGFFVAVPVAVTFLDKVACVARVEGASMQVTLT